MNRIYQWHYNKTRTRMIKETEKYGLRILDEDKFNIHVKESTRKNIIYNVLFAVLIIAIILKWIL